MADKNKDKELLKDFHFASEDEKVLGVQTAVYANGNEVKKFSISGDREVIVRELNGHDMLQVNKLVVGDADNYIPAMMHYSVKIDGKQLPVEDFPKMKGKDFNKIQIQVMALNF